MNPRWLFTTLLCLTDNPFHPFLGYNQETFFNKLNNALIPIILSLHNKQLSYWSNLPTEVRPIELPPKYVSPVDLEQAVLEDEESDIDEQKAIVAFDE
ncbi:unnamed protein product [Arabidopsis thaliana]|uniref:(thale cress) hypothetical protein n=1 Tax=Arabidopsis thaliana TaxID=3702 RepID=A0A7G2FBF5_ARATH|nr:unnamed protein product [Arabidopsis thaliana]